MWCKECEPKGTMEDIVYNPDCPNFSSCDCLSCGLFTGESVDTFCPEGNPCYDCGHINPPVECPVFPGEGSGRRKLDIEEE